jgi:uncharacterized OB-fold protein
MPTRESAPFWQGAARGELTLPRCRACGRLHYPPLPRCMNCLTENLEWTRLSGQGRLVGWTTVHTSLSQGFEAPFVIGEIELAEQKDLVMATLIVNVAPERLRLGQNVTVSFAPGSTASFAYPQFEPERVSQMGERT